MTPLPEVAIAFAKECLGWEDADLFEKDTIRYVYHNHGKGGCLYFSSLGMVLPEVEKFLQKNNLRAKGRPRRLGLSITYGSVKKKWHVSVKAGRIGQSEPNIIADYTKPDLCHAVLGACVEAARRMKKQEQLAKG
jgi:hypothetical protein